MHETYFDHNATSPLRPVARDAMLEVFSNSSGNPSSVHQLGIRARSELDAARSTISDLLNADEYDVIFTSGATESNNLAIQGAVTRQGAKVWVTTRTEHPSLAMPIERRAHDLGFEVRYLDLDAYGRIDVDSARERIDDDVALVAVQHANHETGVIQPIEELEPIAKRVGALFHVDAAQSVGRIRFSPHGDSVAIASHKLGGPIGTGALLRRKGIELRPQLLGGKQEFGCRAGTPAVALCVGFCAAVRAATQSVDATREVHEEFVSRILASLDENGIAYGLHSPRGRSLPNTLCVSFPRVDRQALLIQLDLAGFFVSAGAACSSGAAEPSPVLGALGLSEEITRSSIRISLGWSTTRVAIDPFIAALPERIRSAGR